MQKSVYFDPVIQKFLEKDAETKDISFSKLMMNISKMYISIRTQEILSDADFKKERAEFARDLIMYGQAIFPRLKTFNPKNK